MCTSHFSLQTYLARRLLFLVFLLGVLLSPGQVVWAATIALWDFPNNTDPPANPPATTCLNTGSCIFSSSSGLATPSLVNGSSTKAWNNSGWNIGATIDTTKYFQLQIGTTGYDTITLSFKEYRGNNPTTSPQNFEVRYSTNGTTFDAFTGGTFTDSSTTTWNTRTFNLSGISTINSQSAVYFRVYAWNGEGIARFDDITVTGDPISLTTDFLGSGSGTVTSLPAKINCVSTSGTSSGICTGNLPTDFGTPIPTSIQLTAAADAVTGSSFTGWSGCSTATTSSITVPMDAAKTCTATFVPTYTLTTSVTGSGTIGLSPTGGSYASGTVVTLTATPSSTFSSWGGDCSGTSATTSVTMSAPKSCTATFNTTVVVVPPPPPPPPATYGLGLKKDGTGTGKVSSDTGMECGNYCTDTFDSDKTVTLTAQPDLGSVFAKFTCSSGESSTQPSLSVRMNAVKICTATFNQVPKYKLSITTQGKGTGTVTSQPAAVSSCGSGCLEFYEGTQVTLIPQPATGAAFTEWSSNCTDGKITINSAGNSCTATFMPLYTLSVATAGAGLGTVISTPAGIECGNGKTVCSKIYGEGVSIALTPTAAAGFAFAGWNPECPDGKVTFTNNKICTATFMPIYTLSVAIAGAPSGKVVSDPAGIDCGSVCSTTVAAGNKIALIPSTSQLGVTFTGWSGDCVGGNLVTMDKDKKCTANFANTGTTQFSSKTYEIKEDAKQAVITVKRVSGATGVLTSYYTTADTTAKADGDYLPTTGMLEWKDGDSSDKTFTVPVNSDNDIEGNETLKVRLLNNSGGVRDEAILTIIDVVIPNALQFFHPVARINETEGNLKLTLVRAANSAGKVNVTYTTQDKDAVAGLDYTATTGTIVWENGDMERKFIDIPILSNPNTANTQFKVVLSNPQPSNIAVLGPNTTVTVSIVNTPTATTAGGSIEFSSDHYDVNESKGNVEILLKRLGSKVGSISALFATNDGSAVQGVDYIAKQQSVVWDDGDDSDKSVILTIPYNAQPEADKVVNLTLSNPSAGANLGAIDKATLRIIDSYATPTTTTPEQPVQHGVIQFTNANYQVEEGGVITLQVSRVGGSTDVVKVKYMTENGTAKTGEDYVGRLGELVWLDGETADKTLTLSTLDNTMRDGDRTFTISLMPIGTASVSNDVANVIVKDNDNTTVQFTNTNFTAMENAGEANITVSRQYGSQGNVMVYYQLQEVSAKAGVDFAQISGRLLWTDGDTADKTFSVKLYDNTTFNGNRTLKLLLTTVEAASLGAPSEATLTIVEDDSSVQGECKQQVDSIDCGFDNSGRTLENVTIAEKGIVQGGTLSGKIESRGMVHDITLQPGTQLIGGMVRGTITGIVDVNRPARLINVKISSATLQHVVIDAQSTLDDDVVLGAGVLFESNVTIPAVNLAQSLGIITPPFPTALPFYAVNLNKDVLFNSITGGIVTAINDLYEMKSWGLKLEQNPLTGYLESTVGTHYYAVMPIEVRQVLKQLLKGEVRAGVSVAADSSVTFITHTGRWVRTIPVLHDGAAFLTGLQSFGLNSFMVLPSGNFRVPVADTGIYYSARPSIFATRAPSRSSIGLEVLRMPILVNYGQASMWQQSLYPAAAQPDAIYVLSKDAVLENDGRLVLKLGSGDSQRTFYGTFDYVVTPGTAPQNGESLFYQIEDKNGDGIPDYRMVYPNGEGQLIFGQ